MSSSSLAVLQSLASLVVPVGIMIIRVLFNSDSFSVSSLYAKHFAPFLQADTRHFSNKLFSAALPIPVIFILAKKNLHCCSFTA